MPIEYKDGWGSAANSTKTITVEYPPEWIDKAVIDLNDDYISFYEKKDYEQGTGGHLFTIERFDNKDYNQLPAYKVIAQDKSRGITYVVIYPTDVQFTEDNTDEYNEMAERIDEIISHIHVVF